MDCYWRGRPDRRCVVGRLNRLIANFYENGDVLHCSHVIGDSQIPLYLLSDVDVRIVIWVVVPNQFIRPKHVQLKETLTRVRCRNHKYQRFTQDKEHNEYDSEGSQLM